MLKPERICMKPSVFNLSTRLSLLLALLLLGAGCTANTPPESETIVLQVNDSAITLPEFNEMLKFSAYADPELEITEQSRDDFVQYLIRRQLMIQEAAHLKLDRKKEFVMTIQTYWESTLIRNLMDLKSQELKQHVLVTEDEITRYYTENKDRFDTPPEEAREQIRTILTSKKVEEKLEQWALDLREKADIRINTAGFDLP
jgi:parvulin-like peptidyl-prolyl isomerase